MGFSRQEYWSRLPIPTPGDLPNPGIEPVSLASPALVDWFYTTAVPEKPEVKGKQVQFLARSLVVKGRREKDQGLEWMRHWVNILVSFLTEQLVGSYFPDQGLNPCSLKWKHGVLTTGLPGNSSLVFFKCEWGSLFPCIY